MKKLIYVSILSFILIGCSSPTKRPIKRSMDRYRLDSAYVEVPVREYFDVSHPQELRFDKEERFQYGLEEVRPPRSHRIQRTRRSRKSRRDMTPCEARLNRHKVMLGQTLENSRCGHKRIRSPRVKKKVKRIKRHTPHQCPLTRNHQRSYERVRKSRSYSHRLTENTEIAYLKKMMRKHNERARRYNKRAKRVATDDAYFKLMRLYKKEMRLANNYFKAYKAY